MDEGDGPTARVLLATPGGDVFAARVQARCGLSLVDHLARLHLEARRLGLPIRVEVPSAGAREVLELAGLAALVGGRATGPDGDDPADRAQSSRTAGSPKAANDSG